MRRPSLGLSKRVYQTQFQNPPSFSHHGRLFVILEILCQYYGVSRKKCADLHITF